MAVPVEVEERSATERIPKCRCEAAALAASDTSWEQLATRISRQGAPGRDIRIVLIRHGETTTNAKRLVTGTTDAPLTSRGRVQAAAAVGSMSDTDFDIAFCSSLSRSRQTLNLLLASGVSADVVHEDDRIAERSLGELELSDAKPIADLARGDLAFAPAGGESYLSVTKRCLEFLLDLRELADALGPGSPTRVLVCTHVGPMRILAGILSGLSSAAAVLNTHFPNSLAVPMTLREVEMPSFLDGYGLT